MSGTSRRGLLKSALAGSMSLIGTQAALGFPSAEAQEEKGGLGAGPLSGTPGGPTSSIQYNAGSSNFGGITNFELTSAGVVKIGPPEVEIPPAPATVPRLQLSTSAFVKIETDTIGTMAAMAFVDNSTTASNATNAEDGFIVSRNYMPSTTVASNFGFSGMTIGISDDPINTQDQSGMYLAGLNVYAELLSPTTIGNAAGIEVFNLSVVKPGQTQTLASFIGLYT
jgi:hypothetical protein